MFPIRDTQPSKSFPLITILLIVANCYIFWHELRLSESELENLMFVYGMVPKAVLDVNGGSAVENLGVATLFSSQFLHGGFWHLLANMWSLWIFGDNVEDKLGKLAFLVFYLVSGATAAIVHLVCFPASDMPTIGASGAIAGVMGAYFVSFPRSRVEVMVPLLFWPIFLEIPAVFFMLVWFLTQFNSGLVALEAVDQVSSGAGIAWWAHVGGFVAGIILLPLFYNRHSRLNQRSN